MTYNVENRNEVEFMPFVLTLGGQLPVGHFGVVAIKMGYIDPPSNVANQQVFSGECHITLANRKLADVFVRYLSGEMLNGNRHPAKVEIARYFLSMKDSGRDVGNLRLDKDVWLFYTQFNEDRSFVKDGPSAEA